MVSKSVTGSVRFFFHLCPCWEDFTSLRVPVSQEINMIGFPHPHMQGGGRNPLYSENRDSSIIRIPWSVAVAGWSRTIFQQSIRQKSIIRSTSVKREWPWMDRNSSSSVPTEPAEFWSIYRQLKSLIDLTFPLKGVALLLMWEWWQAQALHQLNKSSIVSSIFLPLPVLLNQGCPTFWSSWATLEEKELSWPTHKIHWG